MQKNKRIILHIGTIKTGTTSIQETLGKNCIQLRKQNVYFPEEKPYCHIVSFIPLFVKNPASLPDIKKKDLSADEIDLNCQRFREYWIDQFKKCSCDHFIISAETLSSPNFKLDSIRKIKAFLEPYFEEVKIILYLRHYDSYIPSKIQQIVKNAFQSASFDELLDFIINSPMSDIYYSKIIKRWATVFGMENIIVRPFDRTEFKNNDLIKDFIYTLGLPVKINAGSISRSNESLGRYAIATLENYNLRYPVFRNGRSNSERGLASFHIPEIVFSQCDDKPFKIEIRYTLQQADKLNKEIDFVNQCFAGNYKFDHVKVNDRPTDFPSIEEVPHSYYLDVINNYNKRLESMQLKINRLEKRLKNRGGQETIVPTTRLTDSHQHAEVPMKKNRHLILHIGKFKTGTTSIQRTLFKNRHKLLDHGVYYPDILPYNHLFTFPFIFFDNPSSSPEIRKRVGSDSTPEQIVESLKAMWVKEFNKCDQDTFIISAESLCTMNESEICRLKEFLSNYFEKVTVVVYMRHIASLLPSMVQQEVKNGFSGSSLDDIVNQLLSGDSKIINYRESLASWINVYSRENIIIRPYDRTTLKNENVVADFLETIGLSAENLNLDEVRTNTSIGERCVSFLVEYNKKYPVFVQDKLNAKRGMGAKFPLWVLENMPDQKSNMKIRITNKQAQAINQEIDYINTFFDGYQFEHVQADNDVSKQAMTTDLTTDFFVDMANNYNLYIENILKKDKKPEEQKNGVPPPEQIISKLYQTAGACNRTVFLNLFRYVKCKLFGLPGFNKNYYLRAYPYAADRAKDPLLHFLVRGVYLGYNPNDHFDTRKYVMKHPELVLRGQNALIDFNRKVRSRR